MPLDEIKTLFSSTDVRVDMLTDIKPDTKLQTWKADSPTVIEALDREE